MTGGLETERKPSLDLLNYELLTNALDTLNARGMRYFSNELERHSVEVEHLSNKSST